MAGAIQKADSQQKRQLTGIGDIQNININGAAVFELELGIVAEKVSFQATGTVAGTVEFSLTGVDYKGSVAIGASQTIVTYSTSLVKKVKVTISSGAGRLVIAGK